MRRFDFDRKPLKEECLRKDNLEGQRVLGDGEKRRKKGFSRKGVEGELEVLGKVLVIISLQLTLKFGCESAHHLSRLVICFCYFKLFSVLSIWRRQPCQCVVYFQVQTKTHKSNFKIPNTTSMRKSPLHISYGNLKRICVTTQSFN